MTFCDLMNHASVVEMTMVKVFNGKKKMNNKTNIYEFCADKYIDLWGIHGPYTDDNQMTYHSTAPVGMLKLTANDKDHTSFSSVFLSLPVNIRRSYKTNKDEIHEDLTVKLVKYFEYLDNINNTNDLNAIEKENWSAFTAAKTFLL